MFNPCVLLKRHIMEQLLISILVRFYGVEENKREVEMDMREMVDKVKRNEPLYGRSSLTPYMQGVASRNSRYSGVWLHVIPWFNFVNHDQVKFGLLTSTGSIAKKVFSTVWTRPSIIDKQRGSSLRSKQSRMQAHNTS